MLALPSPIQPSLLLTALLALSPLSITAGCGVSRAIFGDDDRQLSGRLDLDGDWTEITLDPALGTRHQTQQVGLAVPDAPRWERDLSVEDSPLDAPGGSRYTIEVDLRSTDGTRYELRAVSFGQFLFFSHSGEQHDGRYSDFPPGEHFDRLYLRSTPSLTVEKVIWSDKTSM